MDITLDKLNGDLLFTNGDFYIDDTTNQEVSDIVISVPGYWKESPYLGCSLELYQKGNIDGLYNIIRSQLRKDGFNINTLTVNLTPLGELDLNIVANR